MISGYGMIARNVFRDIFRTLALQVNNICHSPELAVFELNGLNKIAEELVVLPLCLVQFIFLIES